MPKKKKMIKAKHKGNDKFNASPKKKKKKKGKKKATLNKGRIYG